MVKELNENLIYEYTPDGVTRMVFIYLSLGYTTAERMKLNRLRGRDTYIRAVSPESISELFAREGLMSW